MNLHRRHPTAEQKRDSIAKALKADPTKSDRQVAEQIKSNRTTVGQIRRQLEQPGDVSIVDTRGDVTGRRQPSHKPKRSTRESTADRPGEALAGNGVDPPESARKRMAEAAADEQAEVAGKPGHIGHIGDSNVGDENTEPEDDAAKRRCRFARGVAAAPHSARGHDLYKTPSVVTKALLGVERLDGVVWEPACGPSAIVEVLRGAGQHVIATDLINYGCPDSRGGVDFLKQTAAPEDPAAILTNPPYRHANRLVRHALTLVPRVIMLLPLAFLEGTGRSDILDGGRLARVHVFRNRVPMMHRASFTGPRASNTRAFGWFVWDRKQGRPPVFDRISWRDLGADRFRPAAHDSFVSRSASDTVSAASPMDQDSAAPRQQLAQAVEEIATLQRRIIRLEIDRDRWRGRYELERDRYQLERKRGGCRTRAARAADRSDLKYRHWRIERHRLHVCG